MAEKALRPAPPPLPATKEDLTSLLRYKQRRTIIDDTMDYNAKLWDNPDYRQYLNAVFDEQAITGKIDYDLLRAADMIQNLARQEGYDSLVNQKPAAIVKALRRVLGRYEGLSFADRREQAEGMQGEEGQPE